MTSASLCKHRFIFRKFHQGNASFISSVRPCDFTRTVLGYITVLETLFSHSVGFHLQVENHQAKSRALITGRISFENLHFTRRRPSLMLQSGPPISNGAGHTRKIWLQILAGDVDYQQIFLHIRRWEEGMRRTRPANDHRGCCSAKD